MGIKRSILARLFTALCATSFVLAACTPPASNTGGSTTGNATAVSSTGTKLDSIPIGIAVAQTSNVALFGTEQVIGAKLAEKYINDKGGINGTPIKLMIQDTAGDENG